MLGFDIHKLAEQFAYHADEPLLFNSGFFLFLFTGFIWVYIILSPMQRPKLIFVTLFSLYFYYKSSGGYFVLLIFAAVVDFTLAKWIHASTDPWRRKFFIVVTLLINLGLLGYFKYSNLLYESFCFVAGKPFEPLDIFLPVGVSFFTFQSLSYTLDVYRGTLKPVDHLVDYAFFVSFFPQLVAGPIVRAADFIPQIYKPTIVTREMLGRAIFLIGCGLFKKAVIADYISVNFVDRVFDAPALYTGLENLFAVYGYALQIYCDFSGYSDMAIGIALLLGFHFNINFDSPYQSRNIIEFWRRWHISLSSWLRDYLYISLGGNRKGKLRTYLNLMITMLLGGLWHGASWRFLIWGGLHGGALAFHKYITERVDLSWRGWRIAGVVITFHFVCFCWIFFRAPDLDTVGQMLAQIVTHFKPQIFFDFIAGYKGVVLLMLLGYALHFMPKRFEFSAEEIITRLPLVGQAACLTAVIVLVLQMKMAGVQPFIYFQF
ncbi:D-alanyl-lipoteichoic acid acyltransferase DltB, MBOAT superfamily [Chryseolinea serpens]|uniref:D-alanyl-lipoteichoic acid acyltransferase DltB, MBOAT superfamily n=1 Tax=Chryseolinea serpens TaxID=947013 RepID=A0A1M5UC98_9BACT|nr:MBOAT family O-acyltransferase [Chryseolinea serpens]SHH60560.1 D-alanyl-lipoteichoic acid acyltransferase DltB, MBOAT superfamily [Chryseolinea serpens]